MYVGKMDAILTDSHLDTRIKMCILMNAIVPARAGEVWEGNAKLVEQLETAHMTSAKTILRCSSTTINSNSALRAEMGMHPLKTNK